MSLFSKPQIPIPPALYIAILGLLSFYLTPFWAIVLIPFGLDGILALPFIALVFLLNLGFAILIHFKYREPDRFTRIVGMTIVAYLLFLVYGFILGYRGLAPDSWNLVPWSIMIYLFLSSPFLVSFAFRQFPANMKRVTFWLIGVLAAGTFIVCILYLLYPNGLR